MARLAAKFVDIEEVAKYLGMSRRTADRLVAGGFIPYYRLPSGRKRFDLEVHLEKSVRDFAVEVFDFRVPYQPETRDSRPETFLLLG